MNNYHIAGCVILYNPTMQTWINIQSYLAYVKVLFVFDNSDEYNTSLVANFQQQPKIKYFNNKENIGIAQALNAACEKAYAERYDWLLTMDQDSCFIDSSINSLLEALVSYQDKEHLGILTPVHITQLTLNEKFIINQKELKVSMTSGNIINLKAWENIGGFKNKFFIDFVDHEYSFRLRKNGFKIIQCSLCKLTHTLGDLKSFTFMGMKLSTSNHNYIRRYYITRNRLAVFKEYLFYDPQMCIIDLYSMVAEFFKILLKEENKLLKVKSVFLGIKDFIIGKYGKYDYHN